jgi:DNA-binding CsgD family transcriptional regulator
MYVRSVDVRALLKLVGEARDLRDAGDCPRAHALHRLSQLVGAEVGVLFHGERLRASAPRVVDYLDHGWTPDERRTVLEFYGSRSGTDDPMIGGLLSRRWREPLVTMRRSDLVASDTWYASALHNELHRPGRLDDVLLSARFVGSKGVSVLLFKRAAGDRPFSPEQREILHLFRGESDWMFRPQSDPLPDVTEQLTRREQDTLRLLLTGGSEKEIAARLGISPHTVHDYVKRLYRKHGVTSRAALMAQRRGGARR